MRTEFLLYRSRTGLTARSPACTEMLHQARGRNRALGLTGYLHLEDGRFYQWLEGPPAAMGEVGRAVLADPRHDAVEVMWRGVQLGRHFPDWRMGFGISEAGTLFHWVAEHGVRVGDIAAFSRALLAFMLSKLAETGPGAG